METQIGTELKIVINKQCACGMFYKYVPALCKIIKHGDAFDGIWFDCSYCHTTLFVPAGEKDKEKRSA